MKQVFTWMLVCVFMFSATIFADMDQALIEKLQNANADQYIPVVVVLNEEFDVTAVAQQFDVRGENAKDQVIQLLKNKADASQSWLTGLCKQRNSQAVDVKSFWIANVVSMKATAKFISELANHPEVKTVFLDEEQVMINFLPGVAESRDAWGLKKIGSNVVNQNGYTGKGVNVAVIDTGVNSKHVDLANRVVMGKNTVANSMNSEDDHGHGSHCAGSVAGTTYGVAPNATILAIKVLSGSGSGTWEGVASGVEYCCEWKDANGKGVDVASMSLGGRPPIQAALKQAFTNALACGVRFAVAAGNNYSAQSIGTPGDLKDVTSVGATDINDAIANFSSKGPVVAYGQPYYIKPDVSAPGVNITSCWIGGSTASNTISGTSMATPHVAGLMAVLLEVNRNLNNEQIRQVLESTSLDLGTAGKDNTFGSGRVQAVQAVEKVKSGATRMEITQDIQFPIVNGEILVSRTAENPLWDMNATVQITVLEPAGNYNGSFVLTAAGQADQSGAISELKSGQTFVLPQTFTLYYGENSLNFKGKYTGTSTATTGTLRIKAVLK